MDTVKHMDVLFQRSGRSRDLLDECIVFSLRSDDWASGQSILVGCVVRTTLPCIAPETNWDVFRNLYLLLGPSISVLPRGRLNRATNVVYFTTETYLPSLTMIIYSPAIVQSSLRYREMPFVSYQRIPFDVFPSTFVLSSTLLHHFRQQRFSW